MTAYAGNGYGGNHAHGNGAGRAAAKPQNLNVHRKALGRLKRDGLGRRVDVSLKQRGGRRGNREFAHYLSDSRKGEAIGRGARACGIKSKKKAKTDYGRVVPGQHTRRRNDFFISLIVRARAINAEAGQTVVDVPVDGMWGESCPEFPLRGAKITRDEGGKLLTGFDLQRAGYENIEPDGRFRVAWPGQGFSGADLTCTYDVETELWSRPAEVMEKIDERAECYSRLFEQHHAAVNERRKVNKLASYDAKTFLGLPNGFVPVLFVFKSEATARNVRAEVLRAVNEGDPALASYVELQRRPEFKPQERVSPDGDEYKTGGLILGRFFLFAGLDRMEQRDPFAPVFHPLFKYPEHLDALAGEEGHVSLEKVAHERADRDRDKAEEGS